MRIEDELLAAANKAHEPLRSLLIRTVDEIRQLRDKLEQAQRGKLNSAMAATSGEQKPPDPA